MAVSLLECSVYNVLVGLLIWNCLLLFLFSFCLSSVLLVCFYPSRCVILLQLKMQCVCYCALFTLEAFLVRLCYRVVLLPLFDLLLWLIMFWNDLYKNIRIDFSNIPPLLFFVLLLVLFWSCIFIQYLFMQLKSSCFFFL